MTADEHPTKISAPQSAAAKRTIIKLAPGLAPQMCVPDRWGRARFGGGNGAISRFRKFRKSRAGSRCSCREKQEQSMKKILISVGFALAFAAD
jgi:hypothetical protein